MKYSLRSLMIVVLVAPPLVAAGWFGWKSFRREEERVWAEEIVEVYHILYEPPNSSAPAEIPPSREP